MVGSDGFGDNPVDDVDDVGVDIGDDVDNSARGPPKAHGFRRGLEPDTILAITELPKGPELAFLIKWKNSELADLVPAREANQQCPQLVIKFYENRLKWKNCKCNCE